MQDNQAKGKTSKGKKIKFVLFTLVFLFVIIFIIGEIILAFMGYPSTSQQMEKFTLTQASWWKCDSVTGPGYLPNQVTKEDSAMFKNEIWYYKRLQAINNEGYHDSDNFTDIPANSDSLRILAAGDSFTWGASADVGSSYIDVLESDIKKVHPGMVWNTGVPATGTNHALFTTKKYLPLQRSNYVVLGFFVANDFGDNLLPYDQLVFNNLASCYNLYDYDKDFKLFKISKREAFKKATGSYPKDELNFIQKVLIKSRFLTFAGDLKKKIINRLSGNKKRATEREDQMATQYLTQLRDYVKENNAELIVLVIPSLEDVSKGKQYHYRSLINILNQLSVKYVEPYDQFTKDDYLTVGGGHWKNSGHIKAGHALSKYLLENIKAKQQTTFRKTSAL